MTPERRFVFERLQIEERKAGKPVWQGTAERAEGDLSEADVQEVRLHCVSDGENGRPYDVYAPRAHLALDDGKARFEEVRVVDATGGTLDAGIADYDEKTARIVARGPLTFFANGLVAHATAATVMLDSGNIDIVGPVVGRFEKPPLPRH